MKPGGRSARPGGSGGPGARGAGGFNPGQMGQFGGEQLDEATMQQMLGGSSGTQSGGGATGAGGTAGAGAHAHSAAAQAAAGARQQPRQVDTPLQELQRAGSDILTGLKEFFSINTWLGISSEATDPQEVAKRKSVHQRFTQLDQEQQAVARQRYQEEMKRKQQEEEEKQRKQQQQQQQKAQQIVMPSSTKKGPVGPSGSGKQKATQKLQQDRQSLSGPSSAN